MAKPLCMNNTNSDANQYSSPIPLIGLYIAGATSVCLLLMLLDTISGIRRKNIYIPCRLFSLNSATLTLIGVASKLPVDLTTYMPSARDQLSKLTGTAMLCICIGFFMPSLGINSESERRAKMIALSLLVITIFVNICIQMSTGVIFSFMVEHIVILCCMLALLFMLWCSSLGNKQIKSFLVEKQRDLFNKGIEASLMHRLEKWYIISRTYNLQLVFCNDFSGVVVDIICLSCSVVVSQAAFRSLILDKCEFCEGISDYKWSMWIIVISQIFIVIMGGLIIGFRWLALILLNTEVKSHNNIREFLDTQLKLSKEMFRHDKIRSILGSEFIDFVLQVSLTKKTRSVKFIVRMSQVSLKLGLIVMFILIFVIIAFVPLCLSIISIAFLMQCSPSISKTSDDDSIISWLKDMELYDNRIYLYKVSKWMARQCVKDVNKWMNERRRESTNNYIVQMLSTTDSSSSVDDSVTCLSMVVLVKILSISIPLALTETLRHTLEEAFEIIYFIDERINARGFSNLRTRQLAKLLWTSGDFDLSMMDSKGHPFGSVDYVISVVEGLNTKSTDFVLCREFVIVKHFIRARNCTTVEELRVAGEQLFAAMLRSILAKLPIAIFKEFNLSPFEEYEERAEAMIRLLCGLDSSLEDKVEWQFPKDVDVTRFFDFQDGGATTREVVSSTSPDVEMDSSLCP